MQQESRSSGDSFGTEAMELPTKGATEALEFHTPTFRRRDPNQMYLSHQRLEGGLGRDLNGSDEISDALQRGDFLDRYETLDRPFLSRSAQIGDHRNSTSNEVNCNKSSGRSSLHTTSSRSTSGQCEKGIAVLYQE